MGLVIKFERTRIGNRGIHIIVDDGCSQNLKKEKGITEDQILAIKGYERNHAAHLFYLNKVISDEMINGSSIKLFCPSCNQHYQITSEDYKKAFEDFLEKEIKCGD